MLVIAGAGIAGVSLLYHLAKIEYSGKILLLDKDNIANRKVSMFVFLEKLKELIPDLELFNSKQYLETTCDTYSYTMFEEEEMIDYRSIRVPNVTGIIDYTAFCRLLFDYSADKLDVEFRKGEIQEIDGIIYCDQELLEFDILIDALGYNSPIQTTVKKPNRYYQLAVAKYRGKLPILENNVRMIVNLTPGGCWIYPNSEGFEIGSGYLSSESQMNRDVKDVLDIAIETIQNTLQIERSPDQYYYGTFAMEPIYSIVDKHWPIIKVGDGVGMIDSYTGTGALVIIEEMKDLANHLANNSGIASYEKCWQDRVKNSYLGRTARSITMFGKYMNDERWRKVLIKRARSDSADVVQKASGKGKHGFWFNLRLLHPLVLWDFISTKRSLKRNLKAQGRLIS